MNDFPFDDNNIDFFAAESLVEDEDLDFPIDANAKGMSRQFLIASAVLVITVLLGVCGIVLALRSEKPSSVADATNIPLTNEAMQTAFAATQTRSAILDSTGMADIERLNNNSTNTAIARASGTASAVNQLLDASRTAIAVSATSSRETLNAIDGQTLTASARPPSMQAQILDANGNPVTGITIQLYQD